MPGLGERTAGATGALVTPDRETEVTFDLTEKALIEPHWSETRRGTQIAPDRSAWSGPESVEQLASGYWILQPLQTKLSELHETTRLSDAVLLLSQCNAIAALKQEPLFRTLAEITGLTVGAGAALAASNNDLFFTFRRASGSTWAAAVEQSRVKPVQEENLVMDRVLEAKVTHPPDEPYFLRWQCPGTHRHAPDQLFNFYFGGPLFAEGYGEYCLTFRADGTCVLFEFALSAWHRRQTWQFAPPGQVMNAGHTMRILPHMRRYIEFRSETNLTAQPIMLFSAIPAMTAKATEIHSPVRQLYRVEASPRTFGLQTIVSVAASSATQTVESTEGMQPSDTLFFATANVSRTVSSVTGPFTVVLTSSVTTVAGELVVNTSKPSTKKTLHSNWVTGQGFVKFDVRRDLKLNWQLSSLRYTGTGFFFDYPLHVPWQIEDAAPVKILLDGANLLSTTPPTVGEFEAQVTGRLINTQTAQFLPTHSGGDGFALPGGSNPVAALLSFFSFTGKRTSFLRGYTVEKPAVTETITPVAFTGTQLVEVQIAGPTADPTHESATLILEDTAGSQERLRIRSGMSVRVRTRYDPNDPMAWSTLFQGRVERAEGLLEGWDEGQQYPHPQWRRFSVTCVGEWLRVTEGIMTGQQQFLKDFNAPESEWVGGEPPTWKIVDAVRALLQAAGYPDNQIDLSAVASNTLRIPVGTEHSGLADPIGFLPVWEHIDRLLRDYLGAYLFFDGNAENGGFRGMWRARFSPRIEAGDTPLWSFTNDLPPAPAAGVTLAHRSEAYGAATSPIRHGSFRSYVIKPEANALLVTALGHLTPDAANTRIVASLYNPRSWHRPGTPDTTDPDDPDYLGRMVPLVITDPLVALSDDPEERRGLLNLFTRRVYNQACRAVRVAEWEAELVLVADASDTLLDGKRPLRYGDFVRVDGEDFLLTSVNPGYDKDHLQQCFYEAELYRAPE